MKKLILPLLLTGFLLADCTPTQEREANNLWKESRDMKHSVEKYQTLKKANNLCSLNEIQIDMQLFLIANELSQENLDIQTIRKLETKLAQIRSENNALFNNNTIQQENAQYMRELTDRLVEIQIKRNQGNQESLHAYQADEGPNKDLGEGEVLLVPVLFANGKDRVQGNKNIDSLVRRIKYTLSQHKNALFTITGYASSLGEAELNEKLSKRRAMSAKNYIENYIPKGKIKTFGMGESDLICNGGYAKKIAGDEYQCIGGSEDEASSRRIEVLWR